MMGPAGKLERKLPAGHEQGERIRPFGFEIKKPNGLNFFSEVSSPSGGQS